MLKRLENLLFSVRKASGLYSIERRKGYRPQRCQMSQELLSETAGNRKTMEFNEFMSIKIVYNSICRMML